MTELRENEAYFRSEFARIRSQAPTGSQVVVVSDRSVVGYFGSTQEALQAWAKLDGAILKNLDGERLPLVASNYLRHPVS